MHSGAVVAAFIVAVLTLSMWGTSGFVRQASAATAWAPWTPNWAYSTGFQDTWDYSDDPTGSQGEYGIDVPLAAGTAIYAPEPGNVIAYQPCQTGTCWSPGRLLMKLSSGPVVGFGHVNQVAAIGPVRGGQQVASVGDQGSLSHVEFMFSFSGSYAARSDFVPSPPVSPTTGCPRNSWTATGGTSVDPCGVLTSFMLGVSPGMSPNRTSGEAIYFGTVNVNDSANQRLFAYVIRAGHLWSNSWTGSGYAWNDLGLPAVGVNATSGAGAFYFGTTDVSDSANQRLFAYVTGSDGHLYSNSWTGSGYAWGDRGLPAAGVNASSGVGAFYFGTSNVNDSANQRLFAYVTGNDGHLYSNVWTGSGYAWGDRG